LGVILHAKRWMVAVAEAFERLIVEIDVGNVDLVEVERIRIDCEAMIVRSNLDLLCDLVNHGVIGAAMTELEIISLASDREAQELMAEADAEDGHASDELAEIGHLRLQRLGIAGAVVEKHTVGIESHAFSTRRAGSLSMAESTPRITPRVRRCRTRARVSRSEITGMPCWARNARACSLERQLLVTLENSRTTSPSM